MKTQKYNFRTTLPLTRIGNLFDTLPEEEQAAAEIRKAIKALRRATQGIK